MYASTKGMSLPFKSHRFIEVTGGSSKPYRRVKRHRVGPAVVAKRADWIPDTPHRLVLIKVGERDVEFIPEKVWRGMDGKVLGRKPAVMRKLPVLHEHVIRIKR